MATQQDYTEAKKITKDYYDSQNERVIASRQLIAAKEEAANDAIASGRAKNNIKDSTKPEYKNSSYNPDNWDPSKNEKVVEQNAIYESAATEEKTQREAVAQYMNTQNPNLTPEERQKNLEAAGLKPGDIQTSLYSSKSTDIQTKAIDIRAKEIEKQATKTIESLDSSIKENNLQIEQNKFEIANIERELMDISDPDERKKLEDRKTSLEKENQSLDSENKTSNMKININENSKKDSKNTAKKYLENEIKNDPTNEKNIENTTKLSNTGFETINNHAPFYMQMPTLQSITDFRLRNGTNPYGERSPDSIARDAVNFRIFETTPGTAKAETIPGTKLVRNVIDDSRILSVGSFTIYPSDLNWLTQSHQHQYSAGNEDWIASTINTLGEGYSAFQGLLKMGAGASAALAEGSIKNLASAGDVYQRRVETLNYYQSTAPQRMAIQFNLFTKKDFLNDVFRPIMFLTALGYPKRSLEGEGAENLSKTFQNLRKWAESGNNFATDMLKGLVGETAESIAKWPIEKIQALEKEMASTGGIGPYRYFISKRPEFLSVRHVSGLFYFPLANITGFTYTFKGPWYNHKGEVISTLGNLDSVISQKINNFRPNPNAPLKERVDQIFKNFAGEVSSSINSMRNKSTAPETLQIPELSVRAQDLKTKAYPSYAECTLEFQSSIPFFRDDYMALYNASIISGEELVNVTQKNTGDERFFGNRKSIDNQVL